MWALCCWKFRAWGSVWAAPQVNRGRMVLNSGYLGSSIGVVGGSWGVLEGLWFRGLGYGARSHTRTRKP